MYNEKVMITRIERFCSELAEQQYPVRVDMTAAFIYEQSAPIPYVAELADPQKQELEIEGREYEFKDINKGEEWGKVWGSGWFRFRGQVPEHWKGKELGVLIDIEAEGCIFREGKPWQGLTNKIHWSPTSAKRLAILDQACAGGEEIFLLVEAGANGLFGAGQEYYRLREASLCVIDRKVWQLYHDLEVIRSLIKALPEKAPRRRKLIYHANEAISIFAGGSGMSKSLQITQELLYDQSERSSMRVYSVGHAHIDLAWLWPIRETRRKAGRTFSTALRMMEEYPSYVFGASQPQLYEWVKEDYPGLYEEMQSRIKEGRWECQGAMWVEPDMNIPSGESLVRQCLYGKKFWQDEFDLEIRNLWLPDVFGYSAALPQILKKSGVDFFMTQKISWNETNIFPHHSFYWEGIDGTRIATHFLPTNDYNCANLPEQLKAAEERYAQSDVTGEFLNLYGIGDGGGGPGRIHIELGERQQNCEGAAKFKFSAARKYFKKLAAVPPEILPVWKGELYLELHRGTYTTQARMKKYNRRLEHELREVEMLGALTGKSDKNLLDRIWKNTLLNQFHDILPGSSIKEVYADAYTMSENNLLILESEKQRLLNELYAGVGKDAREWHYMVYNSLSWQRQEIITLDLPDDDEGWQAYDGLGNTLSCAVNKGVMQVQVEVPGCGYTSVQLKKENMKIVNSSRLQVNEHKIENNLLRVEFDDNGAIVSIIDKEQQREMLQGKANQLLMYEDKPNDWGAWDINHYYRDTEPEEAQLVSVQVHVNDHLWAGLWLEYTVGKSEISQLISLKADSRLIECWTWVNWREKDKMLRMRAVPDIRSEYAAFEIQYGNIKRATHNNTSWDEAKFEVCGHRYADLSQSDCGFAIVNDCKYGHYVKDNVMELTLLRSPQYPDKGADRGEHTFRYGFLPHKNELKYSEVFQKAHEFNAELICQQVAELPEEWQRSYFEISGGNVKLESVKPAEDGNGIILRFYEYYGTISEIEMKTARKWSSLIETDLLERDQHLDSKNTFQTRFDFKPFEIRTFRLIW